LSLITMSFFVGLVGSILILFVGIVYFILNFARPGKEPSHMSYATYQSIVVRGNTPIIGSQPTQMKQKAESPPLPTHGQYQFAPQKLLPEHQAVNVAPSSPSKPEPQDVQPTPLESIAVTNESKEKIEVS
ncbi:hypothetical protein CU098_005660, partial [Rhizopus stolonifer]